MNQATEADEILANALVSDASAHEAGEYQTIANRYDDVYGELLPIQCMSERRFAIAFNFWDSWCDASNHDWQYYSGIRKDDWPVLAREIAAALRQGTDPENPIVVARFAPENLRPLRQRIWDWLCGLWKRSGQP